MRKVSDRFETLISDTVRNKGIRGTIHPKDGSDVITLEQEDFVFNSIQISKKATNGNSFAFGGVSIDVLEFSIERTEDINLRYLIDAEVNLIFSIYDQDDSTFSEDLDLGWWVILAGGVEKQHKRVNIRAYSLLAKFDKIIPAGSTFTGVLRNTVAYAGTRCGVSVDEATIADWDDTLSFTVGSGSGIETWRDFLQHSAIARAGYFTISADKKLTFKQFVGFGDPAYRIDLNKDTIKTSKFGETVNIETVSGVVSGEPYEVVADNQTDKGVTLYLSESIILGTEASKFAMVQRTLNAIAGYNICDFKVTYNGNPVIEPGDYVNIDGTSYLITNVVWKFSSQGILSCVPFKQGKSSYTARPSTGTGTGASSNSSGDTSGGGTIDTSIIPDHNSLPLGAEDTSNVLPKVEGTFDVTKSYTNASCRLSEYDNAYTWLDMPWNNMIPFENATPLKRFSLGIFYAQDFSPDIAPTMPFKWGFEGTYSVVGRVNINDYTDSDGKTVEIEEPIYDAPLLDKIMLNYKEDKSYEEYKLTGFVVRFIGGDLNIAARLIIGNTVVYQSWHEHELQKESPFLEQYLDETGRVISGSLKAGMYRDADYVDFDLTNLATLEEFNGQPFYLEFVYNPKPGFEVGENSASVDMHYTHFHEEGSDQMEESMDVHYKSKEYDYENLYPSKKHSIHSGTIFKCEGILGDMYDVSAIVSFKPFIDASFTYSLNGYTPQDATLAEVLNSKLSQLDLQKINSALGELYFKLYELSYAVSNNEEHISSILNRIQILSSVTQRLSEAEATLLVLSTKVATNTTNIEVLQSSLSALTDQFKYQERIVLDTAMRLNAVEQHLNISSPTIESLTIVDGYYAFRTDEGVYYVPNNYVFRLLADVKGYSLPQVRFKHRTTVDGEYTTDLDFNQSIIGDITVSKYNVLYYFNVDVLAGATELTMDSDTQIYIYRAPLVTTTASLSGKQKHGETVYLTANGNYGLPVVDSERFAYEYKFVIRVGDFDAEDLVIQDWGSSDKCSFTTDYEKYGNRTIYLHAYARDGFSEVLSSRRNVFVGELALTVLVPETVFAGEEFPVQGNAEYGGGTYLYKYSISDSYTSSAVLTDLSDWISDHTFSPVINIVGVYYFFITVRDQFGVEVRRYKKISVI